VGDVDQLQNAEERLAQLEQESRSERLEADKAELAEAPIKETASRPRRPELIPLDQIDTGLNIRTGKLEKVHNLALSIRQRGLLSPLEVRESPEGASKPFQLVAGYRRFAALKLVHADNLSEPARAEVIEGLTDAEVAELQLLENGQRVQLKPMEIARALRMILNENPELSAATVARSLGFRPDWVRRHFRTLELPQEVQDRLEAGDLSFTVADILRKAEKKGQATEEQVKEIAKQVAEGDVSAKDVRAMFPSEKPKLEEAEEGQWAPLGADGRKTDATLADPDEARRTAELERQADAILAQAEALRLPDPPPVEKLPADEDDAASMALVPYRPLVRDDKVAEGAPVADALIDALPAETLEVYLLGRLLRDSASTDHLLELAVPRGDTYEYASRLDANERSKALQELARDLARRDRRFPAEIVSGT
jgi:ParB/RepB/Spo0J family partition protein